MPKKKPVVVVTRRLPDSVETRMRELFEAQLNIDDRPLSQQGLIEAVSKSAARAIGSELGRQVIRGVLGSILGGKRRR